MTDGKTKDDIKGITDEIRANCDAVVIAVGLKKAPINELITIAKLESKISILHKTHFKNLAHFDSLTRDQTWANWNRPVPQEQAPVSV